MVVSVRDTNVLVLLQIGCLSLLIKAGTSEHPRYIPVHEIWRKIPFDTICWSQ